MNCVGSFFLQNQVVIYCNSENLNFSKTSSHKHSISFFEMTQDKTKVFFQASFWMFPCEVKQTAFLWTVNEVLLLSNVENLNNKKAKVKKSESVIHYLIPRRHNEELRSTLGIKSIGAKWNCEICLEYLNNCTVFIYSVDVNCILQWEMVWINMHYLYTCKQW